MPNFRDWDYISDLCDRRGEVDFMAISREVGEIPNKKLLNSFGPLLYQEYLYAICRILRPTVVVETGTRYGIGSSMILRALDKNENGTLYSCDPLYASQREAMEKMRELHGFASFDRFRFFPGESANVLPTLATHKDEWDLFVHDSDHGAKNMRWELDFALGNMRKGGMIVCDDWDWPDEYDDAKRPHHALRRFCVRQNLAYHICGTAAVVEL